MNFKNFLILGLIFYSQVIYAHNGEKHSKLKGKKNTDKKIVTDTEVINSINAEYIKKVKPVFQKSCFNCHSSNTIYPWYYKLPLVKQLINGDIREAKEHLDLSSDFPFGGHGKPKDDLLEIQRTISEESMPPWYYKIFHQESSLSDSENNLVAGWLKKSLILINDID
jgi:hypothetical protein